MLCRAGRMFAASAILGLSACSLSDLVSTSLPSNVTDPALLETPQGAIDRYKATIMKFRTIVSGYNSGNVFYIVSGLLSDELTSGEYNTLTSGNYSNNSIIDSRNMSSYNETGLYNTSQTEVWRGLAAVRMIAQDGISALRAYAPNAPKDLQGHAYALMGMSEVMLAELYCSGIPLATLIPGGGYEYGVGLTSNQVYEQAIAHFDSAITLLQDSVHYRNFARIGKARALINLNRYADAATTVNGIPTSFKYQNLHSLLPAGAIGVANFTRFGAGAYGIVGEKEGGKGYDYVTAADPRVLINDTTFTMTAWPLTDVVLPRKWATPDGAASVTVADGIEARLIEAEAALKTGGGWLAILNDLRTSSGGVAGLGALTDPATEAERVDLLFRERAFWLYLTGHRHGDLRRLVRQYSRVASDVFPVGQYRVGPDGSYGSDVVLPAPASEKQNNHKYKGCFNLEA